MSPSTERYDPQRRHPDWRWCLAVERAEHPSGPFRPCPEALVRLAQRFWSAWQACPDEQARQRLAHCMPRIFQAYSIYCDPDSPLRHALEARVLCGEDPTKIAAKAELPVEVVCCYEELFFDVRSRLLSRDYIYTTVLAPYLHGTTVGWGYGAAWGVFGYAGGSAVLDELIAEVGSGDRPKSFEGVQAFLSDSARAAVQRQIAIAVGTLHGGDPQTARALLQLYAQMQKGQPEGGATGSPNMFERHISAMLDELPWTVGREGRGRRGAIVADFEDLPVELRDNEIMRAVAGEPVPDADEIKKLAFPPPRRKDPKTDSLPTELESKKQPPPEAGTDANKPPRRNPRQPRPVRGS